MRSVYIVMLRKIKEETAFELNNEPKSDIISKESERKDIMTLEKKEPMYEAKVNTVDHNDKFKTESILTKPEWEESLVREKEDPEDGGRVDTVMHNDEYKLHNISAISV